MKKSFNRSQVLTFRASNSGSSFVKAITNEGLIHNYIIPVAIYEAVKAREIAEVQFNSEGVPGESGSEYENWVQYNDFEVIDDEVNQLEYDARKESARTTVLESKIKLATAAKNAASAGIDSTTLAELAPDLNLASLTSN